MHIIKIILNQILAHPAWAGLGVLVAVLALVISLVQNSGNQSVESVGQGSKNEENKAEKKAPVFVSQRIALVIGNADYSVEQSITSTRGLRISTSNYKPPIQGASTISRLKNPINDAKSIIKILKKKNFKIIKGFNVNKKELIALVNKFQTILSAGGIGVFYYGGHAISVEENDYLLPVTAKDVSTEEKFIEEAVNVTDILRPVERLIDEHPKNTGSVVIYAASKGRVAYDGVGSNSPFTKAFVSSLEKSNSETGLFDVFVKIAKGTTEETDEQQTPWLSGFSYSNFYFDERAKDKDISLMKILFIDACRDNPFENAR